MPFTLVARRSLSSLALTFLLPTAAVAQYDYTGAGANSRWSTVANWAGGILPVSGPNTTIVFENPPGIQSNSDQDLSSLFILNSLTFLRETNSVYTYFHLSGGTFQFQADGTGTLPTLMHNSVAGRQITSGFILADTLTVGGVGGSPLTLAGPVSGPGGLVKSGDYELIVSGTASYTGPTSVLGGKLTISASALTGDILNNGVLQIDSIYRGTINGSGSVIVLNNRNLTLTGMNSYAGGTTVNVGGTLVAGSDAALGAAAGGLTLNGGDLRASASFTSPRAVTITSDGASIDMTGPGVFLELSGTISGPAGGSDSLMKYSAGTLTLSGTANTFAGSIWAREGVVRVTNPGAIQSVPEILILGGGVLAVGYTPDATLLGKIFSTSTGVFALTGDTSVNLQFPASVFLGAWGGPVTYSGNLSPVSGAYRLGGGASSTAVGSVGTLTLASNLTDANAGVTVGTGNALSGYGTVVLAGTNTYGGGTTVNAYAVLRIDADARLGASGTTLTLNGGTLQAGGSFTSPRPVALTSASTVDTAGFNVTLSGIVTGPSGFALTKLGTGTLTLTGTNTYSGGTNILDGTLGVSSDAALGTGAVIVSALGTLSYVATTSSNKSFNLAGGTLAVSAGAVLTLNGGTVTNGFLRGAGTLSTSAATGAQFGAVTAQPAITIASNSGLDRFVNFSNGGMLNVAAGLASPVTFSGFVNQGSGSITVGADSKVNASDFQSYGLLTLKPAVSGQLTLLTNTGTSPMFFNGGSRTFVGLPLAGPHNLAGFDLHGQNLIVAGGLFVNNDFVADSTSTPGNVIVDYGALYKGAGNNFVNVITQNGGRVQAGNSPGSMGFGRFVFGPGGVNNYVFSIDDATGTAGPSPDALGHVSGWGLVKAVKAQFGATTSSGDFVWTATPSSKLTVAIDTLVNPTTVGTDVAGPMDHFDPNSAYSWPAVQWAGTYSGPSDTAMLDAATSFDTSGFANPVAGTFGWSLGGSSLSLSYTPSAVPEPGSFVLVAFTAVGLARRRHRKNLLAAPGGTD
jgi:autotransporter-associated beta strand protein